MLMSLSNKINGRIRKMKKKKKKKIGNKVSVSVNSYVKGTEK